MRKRISEFSLGDMRAVYETDESGQVGLALVPESLPDLCGKKERSGVDSLVQVKIAGDIYQGCYAPGNTLRDSETVHQLRLVSQKEDRNEHLVTIETILEDERGCRAIHRLFWRPGAAYVRISTIFENAGDSPVSLEMLSSFSLEQLSGYLDGDGHGDLLLHRIRSRWSSEGRLETRPLEDLEMETAWSLWCVRAERFGSIGSMPVNGFFPFLAVEDRRNSILWGAQLETPSSWQMELYRLDENLTMDGGIADRELGHWLKTIEPGEAFEAPQAIVSVCHPDASLSGTHRLDELCARLVSAAREIEPFLPSSEQDLPVLFNEYCTTWGNPSSENVRSIVEAIKDKGFAYFVIDAGWYREKDVDWGSSIGDYVPSAEYFPEGIDKIAAMIREAGMIPGVWFEMENVGPSARAYSLVEHQLHRDGVPLTTTRRRFWDMTDPWVTEYLDRKVIGMLRDNGFGYIKVDYNDETGVGADGCESPGEKLRAHMQASYRYFERMREKLPDLVIENCASGGHRLEPGYMKRSSMASFSDAHECPEIPVIAGDLHRVILPRQSQIWAVVRKTDSLKRIAWSVISTYLGRMCISGDVLELSDAQWKMIEDGIAFYKKIVPVLKDGVSYHYGPEIRALRHPEGWQAVVRKTEKEAMIVWHTFAGEVPESVSVMLPDDGDWQIADVISDAPPVVRVHGNKVEWEPLENFRAAAVLLKKI